MLSCKGDQLKKRSPNLRVLIADDHEMMRSGLRNFFLHYFKGADVFEASSYEQVAAVLPRTSSEGKLDIILIDLKMPDTSGNRWSDSLRMICETFAGTPVVIISGMEDPMTISTALKNGARGFLPKTMRGQSMYAALGLVLAGEIYVPPHLANDISDRPVSPASRRPVSMPGDDPAPGEKLSARELAVVELLVRGLSNKEIARKLLVQEITVKVHLRSIFRKLGASNRVSAVRIALATHILASDTISPTIQNI